MIAGTGEEREVVYDHDARLDGVVEGDESQESGEPGGGRLLERGVLMEGE